MDKGYNCSNDILQCVREFYITIVGYHWGRWDRRWSNKHSYYGSWRPIAEMQKFCQNNQATNLWVLLHLNCSWEGRRDSLNRLWAGDNHWMQAFSNSKSLPSKSRSVFTRRNINWMTQCLTHKNYQAQALYNVHVEPWVQLCLLRTELPFQFSCWNFSCSSIICKMQCI